MAQSILLTNGEIITPIRWISQGAVLIEAGIIKEIGPAAAIKAPPGAEIIDVKGSYISPGFIDLHLHGAWGGNVMAASIADLKLMSKGLVKGGVTSFLPTTLSGSLTSISAAVESIEQAMEEDLNGAKVIGAHLEGPYFNQAQRGAQNPKYIINPNPDDYLPILNRFPCIKRMSLAPELPGALKLGRELAKRGIVASIAHSSASYQQVLQAIENGFTHATHIFSGMSGIERIKAYRISGVIESVLLLDELTTEMITDGHHLPPSLMKLVLKNKGCDRVCLVTDSMAAAGLGPGKYDLGGLEVIVEADIPEEFEILTQERNRVAKLIDRSAFASSVATMDQLVRNAVKYIGVDLPDALKMVTLNPARMQGIQNECGLIAPGMKADLTVFDGEINIQLTIVDGKIVHRKLDESMGMVGA